MLRSATHVGSRNRLARSRGVKLHDHRTPSRLVPLSALRFQRVSDRSPWSEVANGVGMLAAATLGTCVALLSLRPPPRISRRR